MLIGIDPGKNGGVALLDDRGELVHGMRMPTLKHGKRDMVDTRKLTEWALVEACMAGDVSHIVIEQVSSMPGQGVASTFSFGRHTGAVEGWALGWDVSVQWVTPAVWKKHFGITRNKRDALSRARLEFGADPRWDVLANDGIAEAGLIALWWHRTQNGPA